MQSQNDGLNAKLSGFQSKIDAKIFECANYQKQAEDIRADLAAKQTAYDDLAKQIRVQDNLIS